MVAVFDKLGLDAEKYRVGATKVHKLILYHEIYIIKLQLILLIALAIKGLIKYNFIYLLFFYFFCRCSSEQVY